MLISKTTKQPFGVLKQIVRLIFIPIVVVTLSIMILLPLFSSLFLYQDAKKQASLISETLTTTFHSLVNHPLTTNFDEFYQSYENGDLKTSQIYERLYQIQNSSSVKPNFYIVDTNGKLTFDSFLLNQPVDGYLNIVNFRLLSENSHDFIPLFSTSSSQNGIMIGRSLKYQDEILGYLLFYLSPQHLETALKLGNTQQLIIASQLDRIYFSNISDLNHFEHLKIKSIFYNLSSLNKKIVLSFESPLTDMGLKMVFLKSLDLIPQILWALFFAFLFSLLTTGVVYYQMHKQYMKEGFQVLNDILSSLSDYEKTGELKMVKSSESFLTAPLNQYNSLLKRIDILLENNRKILTMSANVEMKQLQAQFNPHFLYNTLASIQALIKTNPSSANEMILLLGKMLRYAIAEEKQHQILLNDDLAYLNDYLKLQKLRFGEYLNYEIKGDDFNYLIPKLIIQPIVENSIIHGYDGANTLKIEINIFQIESDLYIMVYDNGRGIDYEQLKDLNDSIKQPQITNLFVGLHNSARRLELLYGKEYGLVVDSILGKGTIVLLKLKAEKEPYV